MKGTNIFVSRLEIKRAHVVFLRVVNLLYFLGNRCFEKRLLNLRINLTISICCIKILNTELSVQFLNLGFETWIRKVWFLDLTIDWDAVMSLWLTIDLGVSLKISRLKKRLSLVLELTSFKDRVVAQERVSTAMILVIQEILCLGLSISCSSDYDRRTKDWVRLVGPSLDLVKVSKLVVRDHIVGY